MSRRDSVFMCPPRFYGVEYVINPWMRGQIGRVNVRRARQQWEALRRLVAAHTSVEIIEPVASLPDMPFTANAGLVFADSFVPARFLFPQRRPEAQHFTSWFSRRGYRILNLPGDGIFEGEGDALWQAHGRRLWCGYGIRTTRPAVGALAALLGVSVIPLRLIDERFYHLDTCFCPLRDGAVLYYPGAFDPVSLDTIRAHVAADDRIEVSLDEALAFTCNAVAVNGTVITNRASERLRARLHERGYDVRTCEMSEFLRAGGSAKCLILTRS